jgi:hypothetical protein
MAKDKQNEVLFEEGLLESAGPVECLGMTFDNDEAQRPRVQKVRGLSDRGR